MIVETEMVMEMVLKGADGGVNGDSGGVVRDDIGSEGSERERIGDRHGVEGGRR